MPLTRRHGAPIFAHSNIDVNKFSERVSKGKHLRIAQAEVNSVSSRRMASLILESSSFAAGNSLAMDFDQSESRPGEEFPGRSFNLPVVLVDIGNNRRMPCLACERQSKVRRSVTVPARSFD